MSRLKSWAVGLAAAITGLAIVPPLIDLSAWHAPLSHEFEQATGYPLRVNGAVHFYLLPRPGLSISNATVKEPDGKTPLLHIDHAKLKLDWLDLLQGRAAITGGEIEGPRFQVRQLADGRLNIENLFNRPASSGRLVWRIQDFSLSGGEFVYQDKNQHFARFHELETQLENPLTDDGNWRLKGKGTLLGWEGGLSLGGPFRYNPSTNRISLPALSMSFGGEDPQWKQVILGADSQVDIDLAPWRIKVGKVLMTARAEHADAKWQATLSTPGVRFENDMLRTLPAQAKVLITQGKRSIESDFELGELVGNMDALSLSTGHAKIDVRLKDPNHQLNLALNSPLTLIQGRELQLPGFELLGDYRHKNMTRGAIPLRQMGQLEVNLRKESFQLRSEGMLDHAPLTVQFGFKNFQDPAYRFDVGLDKLDLTPYLPLASEEARDLQTNQPIDFSWLEGWQAKGKLRLDELVIGKFRALNIRSDVEAGNRLLKLNPLSAEVYQGRLEGLLELTHGPQTRIKLKQKLSNMDIQHLLADLLQLIRFEGRGNLDVDLVAQGASLDQWLHTMEGQINLGLNHGSIRGIDLTRTLQTVSSNLAKLTGTESQAADQDASTPFSDLKARFKVTQGKAQNDDLQIRAGLINVTGKGNLSFAENRINYLLLASVAPNTGIREFQPLRGMAVPVEIIGPLDAPTYRIDYLNLTGKTK